MHTWPAVTFSAINCRPSPLPIFINLPLYLSFNQSKASDMAIAFFRHSFQFLLIVLALNSSIKLTSAGRHISRAHTTSTEFIKTSCSSTTYPQLCYKSLSNQASLIRTSPQLMANAALNVTLSTAKETSGMVMELSKGNGLQPVEMQAVQDCVEELSDAVDELRKSIGEMGKIKGSNFGLMMNDIQTWVSAALTDESTCTDGFEGHTSEGAKNAVRSKVLTIAHLTSNALALVDNYASHHG